MLIDTLPTYSSTIDAQGGHPIRVRSSGWPCSGPSTITVDVGPIALYLSADDAEALGEHLVAAAKHYRAAAAGEGAQQ